MTKILKLTPKSGKRLNIFVDKITGIQGYETGTDVWVIGGNFFNVKETEAEIIKLIIGDKKHGTGLGYIEF